VDIGGSIVVSSTADQARSYLYMAAIGNGGGTADIHVHGDVSLTSTSGLSGSAAATLNEAGIRAVGDATVEIDGVLSTTLNGHDNSMNEFQIISTGNGQVDIGSINYSNNGVHGWIDIYSDHLNGIHIGDVTMNVAAGSDARFHLQDADAAFVTTDQTLMYHANPNTNIQMGDLYLTGGGSSYLYLRSTDVDTIHVSPASGDVHIWYESIANRGTLADAPVDIIAGFDASKIELTFERIHADSSNFADIGTFTTMAAMNAAVMQSLDTDGHTYVFAVYNGTEDINHNGVADDAGQGVLAMDTDHVGVDMAVMLPGVTHITPTDLS
jgi:hypothetical protein